MSLRVFRGEILTSALRADDLDFGGGFKDRVIFAGSLKFTCTCGR